MLLDYIKDLTDALVRLDMKIGFRGLVKYVALILLIFGLFNFKSIVKGGIQLVTDIQDEIHSEKMEKRDQLLAELFPILTEFRGETGADRVLYFEYHNSKENLVGIPFKYIDLVLQSTRYGVIPVSEHSYQDINVGAITSLYEIIKTGDPVYCHGSGDTEFQRRHQGTYALLQEVEDGSKRQMFVSIPGVNQPIGMIVLEWLGDGEDNNTEQVRRAIKNFIPRINGLILSKQ